MSLEYNNNVFLKGFEPNGYPKQTVNAFFDIKLYTPKAVSCQIILIIFERQLIANKSEHQGTFTRIILGLHLLGPTYTDH